MQTNTLILLQSFLIISNIWAASGNFGAALVWFGAAVATFALAFIQRSNDETTD